MHPARVLRSERLLVIGLLDYAAPIQPALSVPSALQEPINQGVRRQELETLAVNFYYVYALKDPRFSPAMPFYIGKGTGSRADDHLVRPDRTRKYARIKEILKDGHKPLVEILVDEVSETQALRLEA